MSNSGTIDPSFIDGTHRKQSLKVARNTIRLVAASVLIALIWAGFRECR